MSKLTQIQSVKRLNPKAKEVFIYHKNNGSTDYLPFRVGDIVRVINWGNSYSSYTEAFVFLTGNYEPPYYSYGDLRRQDGEKQLFKIVKVAEHGRFADAILFYIQDRAKRGVVIGSRGLKLVKQFPLRKNETINIVLEKIK